MATNPKSAAVVGDVNRSCLKVISNTKSNKQTVLTSWDDMIAAKMPKDSVKKAYEKHFGTNPDEVHINDDFCKNYGWLSYNQLGDTKYHDVSVVPKIEIAAERFLQNDTDDPFTQTVTLETTVSNSATTTVTNSSSISAGTSITIGAEELGLGAEFSQSFSFSNEVGSSSTQETTVNISDEVKVTVPPHSKLRVYLKIKWDERKADFEIPVTIDPNGLTGAQFAHTVEGHYYWAAAHGKFFVPPFSSTLKGSLEAAYNTSGTVNVEPAKPTME